MSTVKPLYPWSRKEAKRLGEEDQWLESYQANCACARAIERTIADGYSEYRLSGDCARKMIQEYGYDRVNFVLANTVQESFEDGRYSRENKEWAEGFFISHDRDSWNQNYAVGSHPGLVDIFINQARKEWQDLGLIDAHSCYDERLDYTGKVVVISPNTLKDEYKTPDDQLFYASHGNGCRPNAIGTKVYGQFLKDGEKSCFRRSEIIGVMKLDLLPDWAKEKVAELASKNSDMTAEEGNSMKMGEPE